MKRIYTCLRAKVIPDGQGETVTMPEIDEFHRLPEVEKWIRDNGVDVHKNDDAAGDLIHQCLDGSWALILCNGKRMAIRHQVTLFQVEPTVG